MQARFVHRCTHVLDNEKTVEFYKKALGFRVDQWTALGPTRFW